MVSLMMLAVMVGAVVIVLPGYARIFDSSEVALPLLTRGLLGVSGFVSSHYIAIIIGFLALITTGVLFFRHKTGKEMLARVQLRLALFRLEINLKICQALALLLEAGQTLAAAVPMCSHVIGNVRVRQDVSALSAHLALGKPFWASLEEVPYIDPMLVSLARVGEETGKLPHTMEICRAHLSALYTQNLGRMSKLIEPVIMLVLGIMVLLVMLAIVLPTFEMATVI